MCINMNMDINLCIEQGNINDMVETTHENFLPMYMELLELKIYQYS